MASLSPELAAIRDSLPEDQRAAFEVAILDQGKSRSRPAAASVEPVEAIVRISADGKRVRYPESFDAYGERFGCSGRTIRSWVEIGKDCEPRDLPPLHHPPSLADWYRAHRDHKVPDGITDAVAAYSDCEAVASAGDDSDTASPKNFSLAGSEERPPEVGAGADESIVFGSDSDLAEDVFVRQLKIVAQGAYEQYTKALKEGRRSQAKTWYKDWMDAVGKLRQWSKELIAIEQERGVLVRKSTLISELVALAGASARNTDKAFDDLIRDLLGRLPTVNRQALDPQISKVREQFPDLVPLLDSVEELLALRANPSEQRKIAVKHRDAAFDKLRMMEFGDSFVEGTKAA